MILITFDKKSLPLGPHTMLAHFPRGRLRLATQAVVSPIHLRLTSAQSTPVGRHDCYCTCLPYRHQRS
ncbi:hypothetical protein PILCRDRAFT_811640 [Piloderma croceum F 1598]|uniref:Uncharacterized protein n=1 Tax=Piloderma croceum (strain F 1598) TaxID=765440 RepID=A0A0C3G4I9_PILCF|nr:hypothetical protein PILCRDRAFT_811640 [Piloderma croceum F 1598]